MNYYHQYNITSKDQEHQQGQVNGLGPPNDLQTVIKTSYVLNYEDYGTTGMSSGDYSYVQPHAPRKIIEMPVGVNDPNEIQTKVKEVNYDADGNMTTIKQKIKDPDNPLVEEEMTLRHYRWDEEDRLRAVDLAPENEEKRPEVATYTYDADGERSIKYVPEGLGAHYSAKDAGRKQHLATMLYPSPLLTVEALDLPTQEELPSDERTLQALNHYHLTRYTKHYFIGSERLNSTIGSRKNLGVLCEPIYGTISAEIVTEMNNKVENAGQALESDYVAFDKTADLGDPYFYSDNEYLTFCGEALPDRYAAFWFHPDHLGSSNYITDLNGNISQHMEYLPFGETLVEEHKNSNNSPYKFNGKELDDETGNYYYGARYLNPKFSIWLSVDPLAEKFPGWSPYNYTFNNPVKFTDPDGNAPIWKPNRKGHLIAEKGDNTRTLANYLGSTVNDVSKNYNIGKNQQFKEGTTVIVNNNVTKATTKSNGLSWDKYNSVSNPREYISPQDSYMCDQCAQMAVNGEDINPQNARKYSQFPNMMKPNPTEGFDQVDNLDGVPINGGIITIGSDHTVSSYGQSNDGTQYVLDKGGYNFKPEVQTLQETIDHFNEVEETNYTMDDVKYYQKVE